MKNILMYLAITALLVVASYKNLENTMHLAAYYIVGSICGIFFVLIVKKLFFKK